jgi:hypothetical protein
MMLFYGMEDIKGEILSLNFRIAGYGQEYAL